MNSTIEKAQAVRADNALQKLCRVDGKIMSRADWMKAAKAAGARVEIGEQNRIQFNRTKYNRMSGREQEEYERKCNEKIVEYRLYNAGEESWYTISKTEYDYFNSL